MRKNVHLVIKTYVREHIISTRRKNKWTKEGMSEKLSMDARSYADIEKGISACGTVTLILYMVFVLDENEQILLLRDLRKQILTHWENIA